MRIQTLPITHKIKVLEPIFTITKGPSAFVSGGINGEMKIWDFRFNLLKTIKKHSGSVSCVKFSRDGRFLASCSDDGKVFIFDATVCAEGNAGSDVIKTIKHASDVTHLEWTPDFLITSNFDGLVLVTRISDFTTFRRLADHPDNILGLALSADFKFLCSYSENKIVLYEDFNVVAQRNLSRGVILENLNSKISFSPDNKLISLGLQFNKKRPVVDILDLHLNSLFSLVGHAAPIEITCFCPAAFKNTKKYFILAVASQDLSLSFWNTQNPTPFVLLKNFTESPILDMFWDGLTLFVSSYDGLVKTVSFDEKELGEKIENDEGEEVFELPFSETNIAIQQNYEKRVDRLDFNEKIDSINLSNFMVNDRTIEEVLRGGSSGGDIKGSSSSGCDRADGRCDKGCGCRACDIKGCGCSGGDIKGCGCRADDIKGCGCSGCDRAEGRCDKGCGGRADGRCDKGCGCSGGDIKGCGCSGGDIKSTGCAAGSAGFDSRTLSTAPTISTAHASISLDSSDLRALPSFSLSPSLDFGLSNELPSTKSESSLSIPAAPKPKRIVPVMVDRPAAAPVLLKTDSSFVVLYDTNLPEKLRLIKSVPFKTVINDYTIELKEEPNGQFNSVAVYRLERLFYSISGPCNKICFNGQFLVIYANHLQVYELTTGCLFLPFISIKLAFVDILDGRLFMLDVYANFTVLDLLKKKSTTGRLPKTKDLSKIQLSKTHFIVAEYVDGKYGNNEFIFYDRKLKTWLCANPNFNSITTNGVDFRNDSDDTMAELEVAFMHYATVKDNKNMMAVLKQFISLIKRIKRLEEYVEYKIVRMLSFLENRQNLEMILEEMNKELFLQKFVFKVCRIYNITR